jgi:endonuclease I
MYEKFHDMRKSISECGEKLNFKKDAEGPDDKFRTGFTSNHL